jgi:hypothetical protein
MAEILADHPRFIIRRLRLAHCSRGPQRCKICAELTTRRICLLDIGPPRPGEVQRPVIEVESNGQRMWREYEIVRSFVDEDEARQYALEHGIVDVRLESGEEDA